MVVRRKIFALGLAAALLGSLSARATPKFSPTEIEGHGEIFYGDLDGDRLKDIVLLDGLDLSIYFQDAGRGFPRAPQLKFHLDERPAILWAARLDPKKDSLLLMTSEGVTELSFTNRAGPPDRREIIHQSTIIPDDTNATRVMLFPLSAATDKNSALLLLPVVGALQVWRHIDDWRLAQTMNDVFETATGPIMKNPGFVRATHLNLSIGDVNRDRRDDLAILQTDAVGRETYRVYLQKADGSFGLEPALTYSQIPEAHTWLCWEDFNHDGKVDLLKSKWLDEPSFLPGQPSGKVVVGAYLADANGKIPAAPQQVFRKNDWTAELPVVDVDGDGYTDLVLGYSPLDTREGLRKQITAQQLDYSLRFYFYRPGIGFPKEMDWQRDITIHLDRVELLISWGRHRIFQRLVSLHGDFNGDGKKDLLVKDHSDHISIYFFVSREQGFNKEADVRIHCPEAIESMEMPDLNGDGVSDLVVKLRNDNVWRIYLSDGR